MTTRMAIEPVRKSVVVETTPQHAYEVFTAGIDRWWPKTHGIGSAPIQASIIEPFVGGRWYTICADGSSVVVGHVRVWCPGERLVIGWEVTAQWKPEPRAEFSSEVEVRFLAEGRDRTRVEVEHRQFERMGEGAGEAMRKAVDGGWPTILGLYAQHAARE